MPVFRGTDNTSWTYAACYSILKGVTYRVGYELAASSYAIKRGVANTLHCKSSLPSNFTGSLIKHLCLVTCTIGERGLILGHKRPQVTQEHYLNRHLAVDLQSSFFKRDLPEKQIICSKFAPWLVRFPGAPVDLRGTAMHQELRQSPSYLVCRHEWMQLKDAKASKEDIKKAKTRMDVELARLRKIETKKLRAEWIRTEGTRALQDEVDSQATERVDNSTLPPWRIKLDNLFLGPRTGHRNKDSICLLHFATVVNKIFGAPTSTVRGTKWP